MSELDQEIRRGLERLSDSTEASEPLTFDRLAARRRQRQSRTRVLAVLPMVVLLGLIGGLIYFGSDDGTTVTADGNRDGSSPLASSPAVSVERTEVVGSKGGTARVVMEFDGPLPRSGVRFVDDIASVDAGDEILYTTQDAAGVHVCESVHSFPPPAEGTVDLLIPADWFAEGEETHTSPLKVIANPAKFVVCGPYNGFFQYSIWGPVSADVDDVDVTIDGDRRRLTVQIRAGNEPTQTGPSGIDADDARAAEVEVRAFLEDLRSGDLASADQRLSSYMGLTAPELLRDPVLRRLVEEEVVVTVTPSWTFTAPAPAAVVTASTGFDSPDGPVVAAFLVDRDLPLGFEGGPIQRVQTVQDTPEVETTVMPGEEIVIPGLPTEGGARAHLGDLEIPVEVDYDAQVMRVTYPTDAEVVAVRVLTLSIATPEQATATAFVLNVVEPAD